MGQQILQIKDEVGATFDLGVTTPEDNAVAIRSYDKDVRSSINKRFGVSLGTGSLVSAAGNTDLVTPSTGKSIRLKWVGLSTSENNTAEVIVTIKIGSSVLYKWALGAPGAFAHGSVREGAINDPLSINLSTAQGVYVNYEYEEF